MGGRAEQSCASRIERSPKARPFANDQGGKLNPLPKQGEIKSPTKSPLTEDVAVISLSERLQRRGRTVGDVATAGKTTKAAAKMYLQGRAMPRSVALLNMMQELEEVWEWIVEVKGCGHPESAETLAAAFHQFLAMRRHGGGGA